MFSSFISSLFSGPFLVGLRYFVLFYPVWLPILLGILFFELWIRYVRTIFIEKQGRVLLEFKLPREITKSPYGMEIMLAALFQSGAASYFETYIDGKIRPWYSLELCSFQGEVHFYMWVQKKFKIIVETQVYAQYPEIEVHEVPDYAEAFNFDHKKNTIWATYLKKSKPNAYPIRTYPDFGLGLDATPEEEFIIDPMTSSLEFLGSVGKGQQIWLQIMIQAHKKTGIKEGEPHGRGFWGKIGKFFREPNRETFRAIYRFENEDWKVEGRKVIADITKKFKDPNNPSGGSRQPTKAETALIACIERGLSKLAFETMIRGIYIAEKDAFDSAYITGLIGFFRQYNDDESNKMTLGKFTDHSDNMKDFYRLGFAGAGRRKRDMWEKNMMNAYKLRSYFNYPYRHYREKKPFIMTSEELATIYHFPGKVASTPTLSRIPSKKAVAPANLPI